MKKITLLLGTILFAAVNLPAQDQNHRGLPDEKIIVNKRYNDKGELMGYDSTAIISWRSDTTLSIGFPFDSLSYQRFPGIEEFLNELWNDSIFGAPSNAAPPFSFGFRFSPFESQPDLKYKPSIPDTHIRPGFPFRFDSLYFDFDFEPVKPFGDESRQQFMQNFESRMNRYFFDSENLFTPQFQNDKQKQEWDELMEKQQREREDFKKRWQQ